MSISRRKFIGNSAAAGSLLLLGATARASADQKWKDVVAWNHSWDAKDAVTYVDEGSEIYGTTKAVRVDTVPDPTGGWALTRDRIKMLKLYTLPAVPGALYQDSSSMFGGRPSWFSDTIIPHNPEKKSYWYSLQSGITTMHPKEDGSPTLLEWPQPWWGAVLVRGVGPFGGHNQAYIDGNPGMVTISRSPGGSVMVRSWTGGKVWGPFIKTKVPYEENTALVQWHANGDKSWLEVNYKGADGVVVTERAEGAIGGRQLDDLHSGYTHTNHTSCIGIAKGIPTIAQTDAVRNWAAPFIPKAVDL